MIWRCQCPLEVMKSLRAETLKTPPSLWAWEGSWLCPTLLFWKSSLPGPFLSRNPGCIFSAVFIFPLSSLAKCEIDVGEYDHFANYKISQPASPTWNINSLWIVSILKVSKGLYAYVYVWWMYILACDFFGKIVYFSPGNLVGFCLFASSLFYGPVSIQSSFWNIVLNLLFHLLCFLLRCQLLSIQLRFGWTLPMHHCKTVVLYFIPIPAAHPILWERLLCIYQQGSNNCGLVFMAS